MKKQRQAAIRRMLDSGSVNSQGELVRLLGEDGFRVSQSTVSRDLREMGVTRGRDAGGKPRYGGKHAGGGSNDSALSRMAPLFLLTVETSGNLAVVKTEPGNAQGLAAAIDAAGVDGVVGTVAGDDTILVVCSEKTGSAEIRKKLLYYAMSQG